MNHPRFCALILAAGLGTRMGGVPKALCRLGGHSFLERVVRLFAAGGVPSCFVVTGHAHDEVAAQARGLGVQTVYNPGYREGMFSSVRVGLGQVAEAGVFHGCFVLPVDIPLVSPIVINEVRKAWHLSREPEGCIFIPETQGLTGHPPLIGRAHFTPAACWQGQEGLRGYMASLLPDREANLLRAGKALPAKANARPAASPRLPAAVSPLPDSLPALPARVPSLPAGPSRLPIVCVPVADAAILRDIDTPEALIEAEEHCHAAQPAL